MEYFRQNKTFGLKYGDILSEIGDFGVKISPFWWIFRDNCPKDGEILAKSSDRGASSGQNLQFQSHFLVVRDFSQPQTRPSRQKLPTTATKPYLLDVASGHVAKTLERRVLLHESGTLSLRLGDALDLLDVLVHRVGQIVVALAEHFVERADNVAVEVRAALQLRE